MQFYRELRKSILNEPVENADDSDDGLAPVSGCGEDTQAGSSRLGEEDRQRINGPGEEHKQNPSERNAKASEADHSGGVLESYAESMVIVMECGLKCVESGTSTGRDCFIFNNCATSQDLLNSLQDILDNKSKFVGSNLNTLVIENISAFYWHQRVSGSRELYKELNALIGEMMKRYACNAIVTMWGIGFERGFKSHVVENFPQELSQATFTPWELFKNVLVAFYNKRRLQI